MHTAVHSPAFALLRLLADGRCRPLAALAADLGVSSRAVMEHLRALNALGAETIAEPGSGVRLAAPLDLLDGARLQRELSFAAPALAVQLLDECDSTNSLLAAHALAPHGSVVACEYQRAGRGRRGRQWLSGIGGSLTFSLLWRFNIAPASLSGLPLAVAVVVARALESMGAADVALKWPNDLLHRGGKFGGILIEVKSGEPGISAATIGIGINVRLPGGVADAIDRPVTDLAAAMGAGSTLPDRTTLLAGLLASLATELPRYDAQGFAAFRQDWLHRHAHQGRHVSLKQNDRVLVKGEAIGVDHDGALLVRSARGIERVHSGEVSLR